MRLYIKSYQLKMNNKTLHKIALLLLNDCDENKQNESPNIQNKFSLPNYKENKTNYKQEQNINIRKMIANKFEELSIEKQKQIKNVKDNYEKKIEAMIEKYEKMITKKDIYIKELQQLCAVRLPTNKPKLVHENEKKSERLGNEQKKQNNLLGFSQTLYLHQAPLYSQLCYSIERPIHQSHPAISQFWATEKIKSQENSNKKDCYRKYQNSIKRTKRHSFSISRHTSKSRHNLVPACPPKYMTNQ